MTLEQCKNCEHLWTIYAVIECRVKKDVVSSIFVGIPCSKYEEKEGKNATNTTNTTDRRR